MHRENIVYLFARRRIPIYYYYILRRIQSLHITENIRWDPETSDIHRSTTERTRGRRAPHTITPGSILNVYFNPRPSARYGSNCRDDEIFLSDTLGRNRNIRAFGYYSARARGQDAMIRQRGIWRIPRRAFFRESTSLRGSYKNSSPDINTRLARARTREYRC